MPVSAPTANGGTRRAWLPSGNAPTVRSTRTWITGGRAVRPLAQRAGDERQGCERSRSWPRRSALVRAVEAIPTWRGAVATQCARLQRSAPGCNAVQHVASWCSTRCNTAHQVATQCARLQRGTPGCNAVPYVPAMCTAMMQRSATRGSLAWLIASTTSVRVLPRYSRLLLRYSIAVRASQYPLPSDHPTSGRRGPTESRPRPSVSWACGRSPAARPPACKPESRRRSSSMLR